MTPKEKANKLCMIFLIQTSTDIPYGVNKTIAKECALIAVDEIIEELPEGSIDYGISARRRFFEEVKQEIENL